MLHRNLIEVENKLAYNMLEEAVTNADVKRALREISLVLISNVLMPIRQKLSEVRQFSDLPKEYREMLENLAAEHSAEKRQYGAVMPEVRSSQIILSSMENIQHLIDAQEECLLNIDTIDTVDKMAVALKIIVELGYTHYEAPESWHHEHFTVINDLISPTREEVDIRVFRSELGEPAQLALTHGIGTAASDLGLESAGQGYSAGKAAFSVVSMETRLKLLCRDYDSTRLAKYADKMAYYKIPLNRDEREPIEVYANRWTTFFEKLIKDPRTGKSLPLIASVSRATARVIVTLQDLEALNKPDGSFDFDKAQIIANCIMGFIVYGGHHSIAEVAEVYNRLLDYIAIRKLETTGSTPAMTETRMPYYRIGDYPSFFNRAYVNHVIKDETKARHTI
ncbi:MAG TPA: hypothetical protein VNC84_06460 [Gammaproteobacteria bacterium]|jgi:hypothetical protein|nr:hypothetical protein [Gammaproteobacteria bacterium]